MKKKTKNGKQPEVQKMKIQIWLNSNASEE